jgi:putative AdoMet-dependent methyltransferase
MHSNDSIDLFDRWADNYDASVHADEGFPFAGYEAVLNTIARVAAPQAGVALLDLGTGTGNLLQHFADTGAELWGLDFSERMLSIAREKLPEAHFIQADLTASDLPPLPVPFARIVSAYVWHGFDLKTKVALIQRLTGRWLAPDGFFVIGDISFPSATERGRARRRWHDAWDPSEHYWAADEAARAFTHAGFTIDYQQISICGGVYRIQPAVG